MSEQPLYLQLRDRLMQRIHTGELPAGSRLPAERELAEGFGTTRVTLRQALAQLESEGVIYRSNRRGWFISSPRLTYEPVTDVSFTRYVAEQGRVPRTEVLGLKSMPASAQVAAALALQPGEPVFRLRRRRFADERLVFVETIWLNPRYLPGLEHQRFEALWKMLSEVYDIKLASKQITITPTALTGGVAEALGVNSGCPGLYITRISETAEGARIEFDEEYWLHDVMTIRVNSQS
ncbi:MAG: UTRA domain-containing protein [Nitrincola lacisaponensis]|uniref:Transcriptional regulator, GntR family n=1 Tax=Nitrincola lacisaponensis TaxID=267850 RepID=A0A063Y0Z2_9GAMM|nr:UTRA domain-containing protein [Nitrincola lacisaponensis]KDE38840.1 Transcriptional regulator, GntR family [Nitrincola lacisaponensis]